MAAKACGPGPSGFSFEAILMLRVMPYSRSSSLMGLPGTYGWSFSTAAVGDKGVSDMAHLRWQNSLRVVHQDAAGQSSDAIGTVLKSNGPGIERPGPMRRG